MVELESEGQLSRSEVAAFLREFAAEIEDGALDHDRAPAGSPTTGEPAEQPATGANRITFIVGGDSATVTVPETVDFDVEVESRSPMFSSRVNQAIELHLSWELEEADEQTGDGIELT